MADIYEFIARQKPTSDTASVEFTSIPATYEFLQLRIAAKTTKGGQNAAQVRIQFNSDTGTNYHYQGMEGYFSSDTWNENFSQDEIHVWGLPTNTMWAQTHGCVIIDIGGYADTDRKTSVRSIGGTLSDAGGGQDTIVGLSGGIWTNKAAVTSIKLLPSSGNFREKSEFTLYGWRNA